MYKIAVIGDRESVSGFACIGVETFPVSDKVFASKKLKELAADDYAVIYVTEALAAEIKDDINKYNDAISPAIILIPGVSGNTGEGMAAVSDRIERAVGSQLIG